VPTAKDFFHPVLYSRDRRLLAASVWPEALELVLQPLQLPLPFVDFPSQRLPLGTIGPSDQN
jgi:hypothetical protein